MIFLKFFAILIILPLIINCVEYIVDNEDDFNTAIHIVSPGDSIVLKGSDNFIFTWRQSFEITVDGTEELPITLISHPNIRFTHNSSSSIVLKASHWILKDFYFLNGHFGIEIDGGRSNQFSDLKFGSMRNYSIIINNGDMNGFTNLEIADCIYGIHIQNSNGNVIEGGNITVEKIGILINGRSIKNIVENIIFKPITDDDRVQFLEIDIDGVEDGSMNEIKGSRFIRYDYGVPSIRLGNTTSGVFVGNNNFSDLGSSGSGSLAPLIISGPNNVVSDNFFNTEHAQIVVNIRLLANGYGCLFRDNKMVVWRGLGAFCIIGDPDVHESLTQITPGNTCNGNMTNIFHWEPPTTTTTTINK